MFSRTVTLVSLNGFDIKLDLGWLVFAVVTSLTLVRHCFPQNLTGQTMPIYLLMAVATVICFFGTQLLREFARVMVGSATGARPNGFTVFLFGGVTETQAELGPARVEFIKALAGPMMSFALAFGFWCIVRLSPVLSLPASLTEVLTYLGILNLFLGLFNLVPAFPLDGGRVLLAFVWHQSGDLLHASRVTARAGYIFASLFFGLGFVFLYVEIFLPGFWLLMIGGYILMVARGNDEMALVAPVFEGRRVGSVMTRMPITVGPDISLAELADKIMLRHGVCFVPVVEEGGLLGYIDRLILAGIDREHWAETQVGDVFVGLDPATVVAETMPVQDLAQLINSTGQRRFMVVKGHSLLGVITMADLNGVATRPTKRSAQAQ